MRKIRRRYWFWLTPEDPLASVLDDLGPHERNEWIVALVRAGLAPGGQRDLILAIERLVANGPAPTSTLPTPPPNTAQAIADAMADFGWTDDDD